MRRLLRALKRLALLLAILLLALGVGLHLRYGGGAPFPDRSDAALWPESSLDVVANLDYPPGNLAVNTDGRLFFTLHPEARPPFNLAQWVDGQAKPWPSEDMQPGGSHEHALVEVLSIRIDRQKRLWALDNGLHGSRQSRLLAFDLDSGAIVHRFEFPRELVGLGSHLNDFQVSPDGETIYIADASFFGKDPAILVYDVNRQHARRVISDHESVRAEYYLPEVQGRRMLAFGLVAIRPGVDSIGLSRDGKWLYFAPVTNNYLYRIASVHLRNPELSPAQLEARIQRFALKSMSDGISLDQAGNIYLSDLEHSAVLRLDPQGQLSTLIRSPRLRWPDGFSFGPDNWLYVSCSALHQVIGLPAKSVRENAPYQIFRFKTPSGGHPGH